MATSSNADVLAGSLNVGCYAGHRYPERPEWVELRGDRIEVAEGERSWREEDRLAFLVRLRDHTRILLYYDPNIDSWNGTLQND